MTYILGLEDLIADKTPTLIGWTVNPTDAADITDGDILTFCDTGSVNANAWHTAARKATDLRDEYRAALIDDAVERADKDLGEQKK